MSVSSTDQTASFLSDIERKFNVALRLMLDAIDRLSEPRTPKRLGDLRNNKLKQVLGLSATIQWRQQYAADQEDVQHQNYSTPGTGPHYAEDGVKQVVDGAEPYFRQAGL